MQRILTLVFDWFQVNDANSADRDCCKSPTTNFPTPTLNLAPVVAFLIIYTIEILQIKLKNANNNDFHLQMLIRRDIPYMRLILKIIIKLNRKY